jgi:glycosyltransferase involved in cell wall biosynthesis
LENRHDFIASLNSGIRQAKGKYIARMDADDRMFSDRLKIQYSTMEAHPEIIVCASWMQFFNSSSVGIISKLNDGYINFPLLKLLNTNIVYHPTTMIRKDFLIQNQIQYEYYPYAEDYRFWFQIAKSGGVFYTVPQALLYYRLSENQVSRVFEKEQRETSLKIRSELLDFLITRNETAYPELSAIYKNLSDLKEKGLVNLEYIISVLSSLLKKTVYEEKNETQIKHTLTEIGNRKIRNKTAKPAVISVIMPVFNMENFVSEAIESILNQSFADFEFIIVDDGSTDETKSILDSIKDFRIVRITNSQREGNYRSRNKGLDACKGKYVCVMDADDVSCLDRLEKQYHFMENNPHYIAAGTDVKFFSENSFPVSVQRLRDERKIKVQLLQDNVCTHPTLIIRNNVLQQYDIRYNEEYVYSADYNLMVDLSRIGNITNIPEFLLFYRNHSGQITSKKREAQKMYRDRIQLRQLQDFRVRPTVDEMMVHYYLMNGLPLSFRQWNIAEKWCNKLLVKNHKLNIYDEDCLFCFLKDKFSDYSR